MREYVPYGPLSRICAQNRGISFIRSPHRPSSACRRATDVRAVICHGRTSGECEPANGTGIAPDDPPLHLEGQELVQELVRDWSGPSVVEERAKLLVGAADVEARVVGQLEEAQIEE